MKGTTMIPIDEVGLELSALAERFLSDHGGTAAARSILDRTDDTLPSFWPSFVELGWLGLHVSDEYGGQGAGLPELAAVVEQLGAGLTPGPFLPTVLASAVVASIGTEAQRKSLLPRLTSGTSAAVGREGDLRRDNDRLDGDAGPILCAGLADILLLPVGDDLVVVERDDAGVTITAHDNFDSTRRFASVRCAGVAADHDRVLSGGVAVATRIGWALAAAEAAGLARACTEMAVAYAKVREQFGRTIGTFQAVKHHCANMLVDSEVATAVAWDAVREASDDTPDADFASAAAAALALPAALACAKKNIQVHGGIGYTWEHDAHLYMRRAQALAAAWGPVTVAQERTSRLAEAGALAQPTVALPPEADAIRSEVRRFRDSLAELDETERKIVLVDSGYAFAHWPQPWGRAAGPVEQLVIDEELRGVPRPQLGIGGWITQTLATHGTPDQQARWVRQSQLGEITWCQLFSEPNAGSDAAGIQTRGVRTDGGWLVTGQKVWTSGAQHVSHGFATVRTDPDAPKHAGVTMMVIDMKAPGMEIRPLRELTGSAQFNEVFFNDVFVPDDDVVGQVNGGWLVARTTLGNERVSIGGGLGGANATELLSILAEKAPGDLGHLRAIGTFIAQNRALVLLNLRSVARAVHGSAPGPEGNVTKLVTAEHSQLVHEYALALLGVEAMVQTDRLRPRMSAFLSSRQNTIAGGTSEITRNQIAERILGLPRDPLLR
jgi:3-oxochol-4-en-24-oyl-CoA dehydrogenase